MKPYPPLGILYICAHLRRKGVQVQVFDSTFSSRQQLFDVIQKGPPSVLGIYANLMTRPNVVEILRCAKDAGWQTIVGGPEPGAYIEEYLDAGADFVVIGEGEITLEELLPVLHGALASVSGMRSQESPSARRAADIIQTRPREQIRDINAQPLAGARSHRHGPLRFCLARTSRHGIGVTDHGPRVSLSLPVVQPSGVRQDPPPQDTGIGSR